MKKLFTILCAVFALSAVSCTQRVRIEASDSSTPTSTTLYKFGDIIQVGDELGIVFAISSDGKHGKAMSLSLTRGDWWDAKHWCHDLGGDWRLPTRSELQMISANRRRINRRLKSFGAPVIDKYSHWSSEEDPDGDAWRVSMYDGDTYGNDKDFDGYVRAVSNF